MVVPVKLLARAKTRLAPFGDAARAELALAFAADVVAAVLRCDAVARVLVVTDDVRAASALRQPGSRVVRDLPGAGLNAALRHGARVLREQDPALGVASLASDLPALDAADLGAALLRVQARAFVPDSAGEGTTLLAAAPGWRLQPSYGPGSRARHLASGAVELSAPAALRLDVDTPDDLAAALRLGVGPHTAAVAAVLA